MPRIPYRETITAKAEAQGKYKKQSGGRGQYGDCWLRLEPLPRSGGFEFVDEVVGGVVPGKYIPAVEKGVREAMKEGVLAGYTVMDVKVAIYYGSYHAVDSSDNAFKVAGSLGFKAAVLKAKPVILEPIMNVEVLVPGDFMGDVMGDLSSRRGKIQGMEQEEHRAEDQGAGAARGAPPLLDVAPFDDAGTGSASSGILALRGSASRGRAEAHRGRRGGEDARPTNIPVQGGVSCRGIRNGLP